MSHVHVALKLAQDHELLLPALRTLPSHTLVAELPRHVLVQVSPEYFVLAGPRDACSEDVPFGRDPVTEWACSHLPGGEEAWSASQENVGWVDAPLVLTHFELLE